MYTLRIVILLLFLSACSVPQPGEDQMADNVKLAEQRENYEYSLLFSSIDNRVKVYVNDEEVAQLDATKGEPEQLELDRFLSKGKNDLRIELFNGTGNLNFDKKWEIYVELFNREEPIEFANEKSANGEQGLVFERTYTIDF